MVFLKQYKRLKITWHNIYCLQTSTRFVYFYFITTHITAFYISKTVHPILQKLHRRQQERSPGHHVPPRREPL